MRLINQRLSSFPLGSPLGFSYYSDVVVLTLVILVLHFPPLHHVSDLAWAGALCFWWKVLFCWFHVSTYIFQQKGILGMPPVPEMLSDVVYYPLNSLWAGSLCTDPFLFLLCVPFGFLSRHTGFHLPLMYCVWNWGFPRPSPLSVVPSSHPCHWHYLAF